MSRARIAAASLLALVAWTVGCAVVTGGAKKDATEAVREATAIEYSRPSEVAESEPALPSLDLGSAPDDARLLRVGDMVAEGVAIVLFAALITSLVHLFQHRLPMLAFLVGAAALLIAGAAFLRAWI